MLDEKSGKNGSNSEVYMQKWQKKDEEKVETEEKARKHEQTCRKIFLKGRMRERAREPLSN